MSERAVLRLGDPRLLQVSTPVTQFNDPQLDSLIEDLWETMAARGGVGIAAPQIGVAKRVVVFGFEQSIRYPDAAPVANTVLINPVIEPLTPTKKTDWEGCLSVPGMRGRVARYVRIRYRAQDQWGRHFAVEAHGFHARVVQHECDHLDGILYPLRITDLHDFGFEQELQEAARI